MPVAPQRNRAIQDVLQHSTSEAYQRRTDRTKADLVTEYERPVVEDTLDVATTTTADAPLGPTGRPMPVFPEPRALTEHGGARVISMCNQKGGVGKTTTVGKLARVLVAEDRDVVLGAADTFRAAAADLRHDVEALAARFGVNFEQACHRLCSLQRSGARGVPFFFLSGFAWPVEAIPAHLNALAQLIPSTAAIDGLVRVTQMGATLPEIAPILWHLWALAAGLGLVVLAVETVSP